MGERSSVDLKLEEIQSIQRSQRVLVIIALLGSAYFARDLILPIVLGFLLALTLSPVSRTMRRIGIPDAISATILVSATGLLILTIILGTAGTIAMWGDELPKMAADIRDKISVMTEAVEDMREATKEVEKFSESQGGTQEVVVKQPSLIDSAFNTITQIGATLAVTLVLAALLLSSGDFFYRKLVQAFPTLTGKKKALATVYNIERRVSRYLLTITVINACLGASLWVYLTALGMPKAYIWGIAAALLNFLPYIGGLIGTVLVGAFAIVQFDSLGYAMLAPLGYQILTASEGQFITPYLVGRRLSMNTVAVFLTVVIWGWLWGIPGALVAVPFLVVFKVICENFDALHMVGMFLSTEDEEELANAKPPVVEKPDLSLSGK